MRPKMKRNSKKLLFWFLVLVLFSIGFQWIGLILTTIASVVAYWYLVDNGNETRDYPVEETALYKRIPVGDGLRYDIFERDGYRCRICGYGKPDGVKIELDHILPVSKGGTNDDWNLQTLCMACNRGKVQS